MKFIFTAYFEKDAIGVDIENILNLLSLQTGLEGIKLENNYISHHLFRMGIHIHIEDEQIHMWIGYHRKLNYLILSVLHCLEKMGGVLEYPVFIPKWAKKKYEEVKDSIEIVKNNS